MVKKMYTVEESDEDDNSKKKPKPGSTYLDETNQFLMSRDESEVHGVKTKQLTDEVLNRRVFSYSNFRWYVRRKFNSFPFCCLSCCVKNKKKDFLWNDAKQKLYEEIDLLEIVKKLRVNQYASDVCLKPQQRDLINFFISYKL